MRFLITAGPTREPIDPVRFISNHSSGKMGFALAEAAMSGGHQVSLISGPVCLRSPEGVQNHPVVTAQQMWDKTQQLLAEHHVDIAILCAAVADYRPKVQEAQKIKKTADEMTLELERTPDILGSMRKVFGFRGFLVGFAAETENLVSNAQRKLERKNCDLVIANDVSRSDTGFDSDQNEVMLCFPDRPAAALPRLSKKELATILIQQITSLAQDKISV